jgi:hypothetical protein
MLGRTSLTDTLGLGGGVTGGNINGHDVMICVFETARFSRFAVARDETKLRRARGVLERGEEARVCERGEEARVCER